MKQKQVLVVGIRIFVKFYFSKLVPRCLVEPDMDGTGGLGTKRRVHASG